MAFGKKTDQPEGVSLPPSDAANTPAPTGDAAARLREFESPPLSPGKPIVAGDAPPSSSDPVGPAAPDPEAAANAPRPNGTADVFWHPTPEQAAAEKRNAEAANEAAGVKADGGDKKKLSTEQRLDKIEAALRAQGHDV